MLNANLSVLRLDFSPYLEADYCQKEAKAIANIGLTYHETINSALNDDKKPLIVLTNSQTDLEKVPQEVWQRTKMIIHPNSGYDNFALDFLKAWDFEVIIGNPIRAQAVANYILSCLFTHFSSLPVSKTWDDKRAWNRKLLSQKNVLLLGHGHIGKILERSLGPVINKLYIYDPYQNKNIDYLSVLKCTDIVIPAMGLNPSSYHFVNEAFLDKLPSHFLLINGARGKLIDQEALIKTMEKSEQAFAYLDVFEHEPFDFKHIAHLKNIFPSSHIAGVYSELGNEMISFQNMIIQDFLKLSENLFLEKHQLLRLRNKITESFII